MTKTTAQRRRRQYGRPMTRESLREVRERRALSLSELADASGVHRATIHRIEQKMCHPLGHTRRSLAEALNVAVDAIAWPEKSQGKGQAA